MLSFYYLCRTGNNHDSVPVLRLIVVICFHFTIFVVLETTNARNNIGSQVLWFAFILLSLSYWKQPQIQRVMKTSRCDLLSFYYLCRTGNNNFRFSASYSLLWFAFILLSLSYWKQRHTMIYTHNIGCDLLSFYYLCRTGNNSQQLAHSLRLVVICFHFTIFVVLETTWSSWTSGVTSLWFAFILLSLSYWKQRLHGQYRPSPGCDLLSFYYLCRTGNNWLQTSLSPGNVVICFHFTIFVVLETTIIIATPNSISCDLLSFYYLCRTGNNQREFDRGNSLVVICFHFTIFVVLETTVFCYENWRNALWFAFILLSLSYWKQHSFVVDSLYLCCDLLSFYYLCRTGNNFSTFLMRCRAVVICFHFTIFVVLETTI